MIPFPFNENRFFFVADHRLVGQLCTNPKSNRSLQSCLKVDTMFNERDRRCAAVQLMLSTDPSYDHRTIASIPEIQIQTVQRLRGLLNASDDPLEVVERKPEAEYTARKTRTKEFIEKVQAIIDQTPQRCGDQVAGGRAWVWQQDSAPAHKSKETQAWLQKEYYNFVPFFHWPPSSPDLSPLDYFVWSYVENITNMTSHNTKASLIAAIRRVFAELPPVLVEKACSQFRIRIEAVMEAEGCYIE